MNALEEFLETAYHRHNDPCLIAPDPLQFVLRYGEPGDQEVAGLLASSLAFGRVEQIAAGVGRVLEGVESPADLAGTQTFESLRRRYRGFVYRFVTGTDVALLLSAAAAVRAKWGSLGAWFADCLDCAGHDALCRFVEGLREHTGGRATYLLADPSRGSACKRLHLYLRWMVRRDRVDPGPWSFLSAALLSVPLDTHMHRVGTALGFTSRRGADARTAMEITEGFRRIRPEDPVRYDFALTRMSMRLGKGLLETLRRL